LAPETGTKSPRSFAAGPHLAVIRTADTLDRDAREFRLDPASGVLALPELSGLRRSLLGWLAGADTAGLDEDGVVALFTSVLRDFYKRRGGQADRGVASGETEGAA
jgi:hypothetical protein